MTSEELEYLGEVLKDERTTILTLCEEEADEEGNVPLEFIRKLMEARNKV